MRTKKIQMPNETIDFISDIMKQKNISLKDAINEWNRNQEIEKYLQVGAIVKVHREKFSDFSGKKGFIGAVLRPCGTGVEQEKSGKFSVYWFEYEGHRFQADLLGYELEPTGEAVSGEFLEEYIKDIDATDSLYEELEQAIQRIY